jgi:hypothetical protein
MQRWEVSMLNKTVVPNDGIVIYLALSYVVDMEEVGVGNPTSIGVVCQVTTAPTSWKRKMYSRGKRDKFQVPSSNRYVDVAGIQKSCFTSSIGC